MMVRRMFVQACAVLLATSVMLAGCGQGGGNPDQTGDNVSIPGLSKQKFIGLPSNNFSVSHDVYGAIDMVMSEVIDDPSSLETEQFSIMLNGPSLPVLDEGKYQVYNDSLGYIELYLQPGESTADEQKYRAVFSILQV